MARMRVKQHFRLFDLLCLNLMIFLYLIQEHLITMNSEEIARGNIPQSQLNDNGIEGITFRNHKLH